MERIYTATCFVVVVLLLPIVVFIGIAMWPYLDEIGHAIALLVVVSTVCASALLIAWTINRIKLWNVKLEKAILDSHVVVAEGIVALIGHKMADIVHLSAMHESSRISTLAIEQGKKDQVDEVTVKELYDGGRSERGIAEDLQIPRAQVRKLLGDHPRR